MEAMKLNKEGSPHTPLEEQERVPNTHGTLGRQCSKNSVNPNPSHARCTSLSLS